MTKYLAALTTNDLKALSLALYSGRLTPPFSAIALRRVITSDALEILIAELEHMMGSGWTPKQIAIFLEGVVTDRALRQLRHPGLDLVTTGPEIDGIDNRDTSVVVRDLFVQANDSVLIAGYAVYQGQHVFQSLADRMQEIPSLDVRVVLDIQRNSGDTSAAFEITRRFAERFREHQWPQDRPLPKLYFDPRSLAPQGEKRSSMHAKCIVIDGRSVFISSANFTEAAQQRNIEVGLVVTSEVIAEQLTRFFSLMIANGSLEELSF